MDKFWGRVEKTDSCWEWQGTKNKGYGLYIEDGRRARAHRVSWEDRYFALPDDLCIDHLCRNRACVRPDHLEPVTWRMNALRAHAASQAVSVERPVTAQPKPTQPAIRSIPDSPAARAYFARRASTGQHWAIASKQAKGTPPLFIDGKLWPAHHLAYAWWNRPLHEDEIVLRSCGIDTCIRPDHLRAVDQGEFRRSRMGGIERWRTQYCTSPAERAAQAQAKAEENARLEGKAMVIRTLAGGMQ